MQAWIYFERLYSIDFALCVCINKKRGVNSPFSINSIINSDYFTNLVELVDEPE